MEPVTHTEQYLSETAEIASKIGPLHVEQMAEVLAGLVGESRLFIIGLGGSAANASHAASDFVNLCGINAICLSDNIAEFTATANDSGWDTAYATMLSRRSVGKTDALMVLSVGGGTNEVSRPLTSAMSYAKQTQMPILGIVGRDGGRVARCAKHCVIVPTVEPSRVTPHTEGWQSVILHLLVSHPALQRTKTKW